MRSATKLPGENQLRIIWFALTALAVTAIIAIAVAAIWGIGQILNLFSPVFWPLAIGVVLAYLLDPPVNWLERRHIPRTLAIIIVFAIVLAVIGGVLASVIPQMTKETNSLVSKIPGYTAQAQQHLNDWVNRAEKAAATLPAPVPATNSPAITNSIARPHSSASTNTKTNAPSPELSSNIHKIHNEIIDSATDWTGKFFAWIGSWLVAQLAKATALFEVIVAIILIPIYAFYFLHHKKWIKSHWTNYVLIQNLRVKEEIVFILYSINQYMVAFFRGQVLVSLCSGILYTIGFLCIGLDYAFLLGSFCMILTMVPFLGSLVSFIISLVLTIMQFGDWAHPLLIVLIFTIVVALENFFYSPHIMGNRVNLHPLVVIVAVMIGITLLGGVLGGILAIPFAAALRVLMFRYVLKRPDVANALLKKT
jgi:predicted PurR-regulated permease PerM